MPDAPPPRRLLAAEGAAWDAYTGADRPPPPSRPWVLTNFVAGLDGSIAIDGRVGALSSPTDQRVFRLLRGLADVVLVGAGTARAEGYGPVRLRPEDALIRRSDDPPPIAVVSRSLRLDVGARLFTEADARTIVITCAAADPARRRAVEAVADVVTAGESDVDLVAALAELRDRGHRTVTCEGGPTLLRDLLDVGAVDELCLTLTPLVGGDPVRLVADEPTPVLTRFRLADVLRADDELMLRYLRDVP